LSFEDTEEKFESHFLLFKWARGYHLYLIFFVALARALYHIMKSDDLINVLASCLFVVITFILCLLNLWLKTSNVFISIAGRIIFWGLVVVNCIEAWELWIDPCPNKSSSICEMILNSTFPFKTTFVLICSSFSSTWVFPPFFDHLCFVRVLICFTPFYPFVYPFVGLLARISLWNYLLCDFY